MAIIDARRMPWVAQPASNPLAGAGAAAATELINAVAWLRRRRCALRGHHMMLHFEPHRLSLRCACGEESPGWNLSRR